MTQENNTECYKVTAFYNNNNNVFTTHSQSVHTSLRSPRGAKTPRTWLASPVTLTISREWTLLCQIELHTDAHADPHRRKWGVWDNPRLLSVSVLLLLPPTTQVTGHTVLTLSWEWLTTN